MDDKSLDNLVRAVRDQHSLACPKCKSELYVVYHEDVEVDTCKQCNGAWVEHMTETMLLRNRPAGLSIDELKRLRKMYEPLGRLDEVRYLPCPVCQQMMMRKNWGAPRA